MSDANMLLFAEELMSAFQKEKLTTTRNLNGKRYVKSFRCCDAISYLVSKHKFTDRDLANQALAMLQLNKLVKTQNGEMITDDNSLAIFMRDHDIAFLADEVCLAQHARKIEQKLYVSNGILTIFHESASGDPFFAFTGKSVVSWLVEMKFCSTRKGAIVLCKQFTGSDILTHVSERINFDDEEDLFFRFSPNFDSGLSFIEFVKSMSFHRTRTVSRSISESDDSNPSSIPKSSVDSGIFTASSIDDPIQRKNSVAQLNPEHVIAIISSNLGNYSASLISRVTVPKQVLVIVLTTHLCSS